MEKQGDDILFFLNEQDTQPILVLHDGNDFLAAMHFPQAQYANSLAAVKASEVAAAPNWALVGAAGAVLLGTSVALAKGASSSDDDVRADSKTSENPNTSNTNHAQQLRDAELAKQQAEQAQKQAESNLQQANADLSAALRDKTAAENAKNTAEQAKQQAENEKTQAESDNARLQNDLNQATENWV